MSVIEGLGDMINFQRIAMPAVFTVAIALAGPLSAQQFGETSKTAEDIAKFEERAARRFTDPTKIADSSKVVKVAPDASVAEPAKPKVKLDAKTKPAVVKTTAVRADIPKSSCKGGYGCIGMAIDSGDPVLVQMGHEMSGMVSDKSSGTFVKPTEGPIANVARMMSKANAGLTIVPSDMLLYTARSENRKMRESKDHLRFIMTIGKKVVHVIARKEISSLKDLDGKRVVMGPDNTAIWVVSNNLVHLHGAKPAERIQLKPPAGIAALLTGKADAVFVVGDAPFKPILKLGEMLQSEEYASKADQFHMLEIKAPDNTTEYKPVVVDYPGLAEKLDTVAILPTLISYDFTRKSTPYFRRRCGELARIGATVRERLEDLRASGHKQWRDTTWDLEAGSWKKDSCFFGTVALRSPGTSNGDVAQASNTLSDKPTGNDDVREAQNILNELGYNVGNADGVLGPKTSAGLKKFQADQGLKPNGAISADLLSTLRVRRKLLL